MSGDRFGQRPGGLQRRTEDLPLSRFRDMIFHSGIEGALEDATRSRSLGELAQGFEAGQDWSRTGADRGEIVRFFEKQLDALVQLGEALNSEPSLPAARKGTASIGLRIFPVAEQEWDQIDWEMTSDIMAFSNAYNGLTNLMQQAEFVLPQGGYYVPAHVRIGADGAQAAAVTRNHRQFSALSNELFLACVTFERGQHALDSGYSQFYSHETSGGGLFRGATHEVVSRIPAISAPGNASRIVFCALEIHECMKDPRPVERAREVIGNIGSMVSTFTGGQCESLADFLRDPPRGASERYAELCAAIFRKLDFF